MPANGSKVSGKDSSHSHDGNSIRSPSWPLSVGGHGWACGSWSQLVYPKRTPRTDWLHWYSRTYNAVEGNSSFYALPDEQMFHRWAEQTAAGFRFSCKFPREISHDLMLVGCDEPLRNFLSRLEILAEADRLGPTFLQLGPRFGPQYFDILANFLKRLPSGMPWAVELRHPGWFDGDSAFETTNAPETAATDNPLTYEHRVNDLLKQLSMDKVLFDSRPLFQSPPSDPTEEIAQGKKPKTPLRQTVTGNRPMLRIVGRNQMELTQPFFEQWAPIVARWILDGRKPLVFVHAPDDARAPEMTCLFMQTLQAHLPSHCLDVPRPPQPDKQLSLFDEDFG